MYLWTLLVAAPVSASAFISWRINLLLSLALLVPILILTLRPIGARPTKQTDSVHR